MSTPEEHWATRLHAAVDDHPGALAFDVPSYVAAGRKRVRRNRAAALVATVAGVVVVAAAVAVVGTRDGASQPAGPIAPHVPEPGSGTNGWVAVDAYQGDGDIYLARPGEDARRLEVAGSDAADDACPAWSPDGTRLLFGRLTSPTASTSGDAELVIVPIAQNGTPGAPTVIGLDGFQVLDGGPDGFDEHPCGIWAPDGRSVAFAGTGEVWVVDTRT